MTEAHPNPTARLPVHPFAELLPRMTPAEYGALRDDIRAHKQRDPAVLLDGQILDGRHRQDACLELGLPLKTVDYDPAWGDPLWFVYGRAVHRHLTDSQKAAAAVAIQERMEAEAKGRSLSNLVQNRAAEVEQSSTPAAERRDGRTRSEWACGLHALTRAQLDVQYQRYCNRGDYADLTRREVNDAILTALFPPPANGKSRDAAGTLFGVSGRYIQDAKLVKRHDAKLFAQVLAGGVTLPRARREVHRAVKREAMARKTAVAPPGAGTWSLVTTDCLAGVGTLRRRHYRLAFIDPPYNVGIDYGRGRKADLLPGPQYVEYWRGRVVEAAEVLTADGSLWVVQADEYAAEWAVMLKSLGFTIRTWIKWFESFGVNVATGFNRCSRHLFHCVLNPDDFVFHAEAVKRPSDRQTIHNDKRADPHGKTWDNVWGINPPIPRLIDNHPERLPDFPTQLPLALCRPIVGCATDPGDHVVDLCNGSGTFLHAAVEAGRHGVGFDLNEKFVRLSRQRLARVGTEVRILPEIEVDQLKWAERSKDGGRASGKSPRRA